MPECAVPGDAGSPGTVSDDEMILLCAVRYCLGRRSYIVSDGIRWVEQRWRGLGTAARAMLLRDLSDALERETRTPGHLGGSQDARAWRDLYARLLVSRASTPA